MKHIRGCDQCKEELEFYFVVEVTLGEFDDKDITDDYRTEAEKLMREVEEEEEREQRTAKRRKRRLALILAVVGLVFSFGVGKTIAELEEQSISTAKPSFVLEGITLPEQFAFVEQAIARFDVPAREFSMSLQVRAQVREQMWRRDFAVTNALRAEGEIRYILPEQFFELHHSFDTWLQGKDGAERRQATILLRPRED